MSRPNEALQRAGKRRPPLNAKSLGAHQGSGPEGKEDDP